MLVCYPPNRIVVIKGNIRNSMRRRINRPLDSIISSRHTFWRPVGSIAPRITIRGRPNVLIIISRAASIYLRTKYFSLSSCAQCRAGNGYGGEKFCSCIGTFSGASNGFHFVHLFCFFLVEGSVSPVFGAIIPNHPSSRNAKFPSCADQRRRLALTLSRTLPSGEM